MWNEKNQFCSGRQAVNLALRLSLAIYLLTSCLTLFCGAQKVETATLHFTVVKDSNGRPVRNAGVVLHPVKENGKQERGGLELKTDAEGNASYDGVPYGKLRIQVLAPGFQTYGEDYDVSKPSLDITVKLKRPSGQYSIYDSHPDEKDKGQGKGPGKQDPSEPQ